MAVQAGFGDALRRVFPPTVFGYLQLRGWTHREILYDCSSVTFRSRQRARREGSSRVTDVEGWYTS